MHRNLKPSNILLSKNNHVRISDFGLSKEESLEISLSKGVGTMRFMAPELFEEEEDDNDIDKKQSNIRYTNKIDVFSFGISLIYIVTEEYPQFNFNDASDSIAHKLKGKVVNWVRELIHRCLSHSPDNRPSFAEIFEIMKLHNYDMFNDNKSGEMTSMQQHQKKEIEKRILKIEAFEYQHQNE